METPVSASIIDMRNYLPMFKHNGKLVFEYTDKNTYEVVKTAKIYYSKELDCMVWEESNPKWAGEWERYDRVRYYKWDDSTSRMVEWRLDGWKWWPFQRPEWVYYKTFYDKDFVYGGVENIPSYPHLTNYPYTINHSDPAGYGFDGSSEVEYIRKYDEYQNTHTAYANVLHVEFNNVFWSDIKDSYWLAAGIGPVSYQQKGEWWAESKTKPVIGATVKRVDWP